MPKYENEWQRLDLLGDIVVALDIEGRVTHLNAAGGDILGWSPDKAIGVSWFDCFIPLDHRAQAWEQFQRIVSGHIDINEYGECPVISTAKGQQRQILWHHSQLRTNCEIVLGTVFSGTDITGHRNAELAIRASEERFRQFMENLPGIALIKDPEHNFIYVNSRGLEVGRNRFCSWLGLEENDEGNSEVIDHLESIDRQVQKDQVVIEHEFEIKKPGKNSIWIKDRKFPIKTSDGRVFVGGIAFDVTEEKIREKNLQQIQKLESVGRLAAGVAHDFNNQLTVILGVTARLISECQNEDCQKEPLMQIQRAAEHARLTADHLMSLTRTHVHRPTILDVGQVFRDFEKNVARWIGDMETTVAVSPGTHSVYVDQVCFNQAILNLAINARDAMPSGGRLVMHARNAILQDQLGEWTPNIEPGEYILIEIKDSGTGMDQATVNRLFEPFFTTKDEGRGTGLGLPMVLRFVEQFRGSISVSSQLGKGTTFRILLPVAEPPEQLVEAGHTASYESEVARTERVLIVDDNEDVRSLLVQVLEKSGYQVVAVNSPFKAETQVANSLGGFRLALVDLMLPQMRGDDLAERLHALDGSLKFLFMSGFDNVDIKGHRVLRKPFLPQILLERIRELLHP